jgi:beta-lactamase superfamily II metal-dependent hydrolase
MKPRGSRRRAVARGLIVLLAVTGCAVSERSLEPAGAPSTAPRSRMRVHFIDVGQGAATLFEFADGAVLVDTGGEETGAFHSVDHLERYLSAFFALRKDLHDHLTSVILTHPHVDHTRGVPSDAAAQRRPGTTARARRCRAARRAADPGARAHSTPRA